MKYLVAICIIFLASCSDMTAQEKELIGHWQWNQNESGFQEKGYVILNSNKTHAYEITTISSSERSTMSQNTEEGYWRVKNYFVCLARKWGGGMIFEQTKVEEEVCYWKIQKDEKGKLYLELETGSSPNVKVYRDEA